MNLLMRATQYHKPHNSYLGFTLIELLLTLLIAAVIAAWGVPQYTKTVERAKAQSALKNMETIYAANLLFQARNNGQSFFVADGDNIIEPDELNNMNGTRSLNLPVPGIAEDRLRCHRRNGGGILVDPQGNRRYFCRQGVKFRVIMDPYAPLSKTPVAWDAFLSTDVVVAPNPACLDGNHPIDNDIPPAIRNGLTADICP